MEESQIIANAEAAKAPTPYIEPIAETAVTPDIDVQTKIDLFTQLGVNMQMLTDTDTNNQIGDIYDWAKMANPSADSLDIAMMVQELMAKLGRTDNPLKSVHDYITIDREMRLLAARRKSMERQIWQ